MNTANDKVVCGNVGWVFDPCMSRKTNPPNSLEQDIKSILKSAIEDVVPPVIEKSMSKVGANLHQGWSSLFGEDAFPPYDPNITKNQAKAAVREDEWTTVGKDGKTLKKKMSLPNVIKQAADDQKQEESRRLNIIIHKVPESDKENPQDHKTEDESLVKNLMHHIGVPQKFTKMFRLGTRDKNDDEQKRPIKVTFEDEKVVSNIMTNAKKLNKAPAELKGLSIGYDMSKDEQGVCRKLVNEARDMSKNSKTHRYRVVGKPGQMIIKGFQIEPQ